MVAFGYLRRASWLDNPQNAAWTEAQRLAIRRFCRRRRIELVDFLEESPGEIEQVALERLMAALERQEADCAVVCEEYEGTPSYNIDHLERKTKIRFFSRRSPLVSLQEAL